MQKKKFSRRQFLKATGAAAGMAVLGQACAPLTQTPSSLDVLLEDANIQIDGNKVVIPVCCSYTGEYHIDNPPKRPIYGIWANNFEQVVKLLDSDDNFPNMDLKQPIRNCLGFAVDKLFQGDTHSARNALAVIAYMLANAYEIEVWLTAKKGMPTDPRKWLTIDYYNKDNQTDVWNMLPLSFSGAPDEDKSPAAVSAKVSKFIGANDGKYPLLTSWLERLVPLADEINLWSVFGGELEKDDEAYTNLWNHFVSLLKECPMKDCTETAISDAAKDQLSQMGIIPDPPTYGNALGALVTKYSDTKSNVKGSLASLNADACEEGMVELQRYIGAMRDVVLEFTRRVDQAIKQAKEDAEAYTNARENLGRENKHIWEIIPHCLEGATLEKFDSSMHAWWGAKKYIMAAISAIVNIPIIIATAGAAIIGAIADFAIDFIELMIGGTLEVLLNFGKCLIKESL